MPNRKHHTRVAVNNNTSVHVYCVQPNTDPGRNSVLIFSHGFSVDGVESRRMFIELSDMLCGRGYTCILFDYRGSGYSDLPFEQMTFDTEVADLHQVVSFVRQNYGDSQIGIWGMSFGCAVAAQVAAERSDISFMVLWCLSAELYNRYRERLGPQIEEIGYTYLDKGFRVEKRFLDSLEHRDTYAAIKAARVPTLLVHGDADDVASVELSRKARAIAPEYTMLREIAGGKHGFKLQPEQYRQAIDITIQWVLEHGSRAPNTSTS